jgi:hypothetical protein
MARDGNAAGPSAFLKEENNLFRSRAEAVLAELGTGLEDVKRD